MTHGKEAGSGDIDTMSILEVLNGSSHGSLELDNWSAIVGDLVVDDNVEFHALVLHYTLQCLEDGNWKKCRKTRIRMRTGRCM